MKKYLVILLVFCMTFGSMSVSNAQGAISFSDLKQDHWAYSAVQEMVSRGVLKGFPDGTFRPQNFVRRSEFATMMVTALGLKAEIPKNATFIDVTEKHWAYANIETAKPYLTGYMINDRMYFKGEEYAVREDMAVALVTALNLQDSAFDLDELERKFSDSVNISANLRKYIVIATSSELISGYPDGTFRPQGQLTRAEAASLLLKVVKSKAVNQENSKVALNEYVTPADKPIQVLETTPANSAVNVPLTTDVVIKYSREIANKDSASLRIFIDVIDEDGNMLLPETDIVGNVITLSLSGLKPATKYTVKIPECIDTDGNKSSPLSFSFTTAESSLPIQVMKTTPNNGAVDVPLTTDVVVKYSRDIANKDSSSFRLFIDVVDEDGNMLLPEKEIVGNVITLSLSGLRPATKYTVKIPECIDSDGNKSSPLSFSFTTDGSSLPIHVLESTPANGAVNIPLTTDVVVKYSREIANKDSSVFRIFIDVTDQDGQMLLPQVDIVGGVITLRLSGMLEPGTLYTVEIPECIDSDGNKSEPVTFSFTTAQ